MLRRGLLPLPAVQQTTEAAQDKVPAAAGRVDYPEAGQPELLSAGSKSPVQDELLHKLRGLERAYFLRAASERSW